MRTMRTTRTTRTTPNRGCNRGARRGWTRQRLDTGFDVTAADLDVHPALPGGRTVANVGVAVLSGGPSQVIARVDLTSGPAISQGPLSSPVTDIAVLYPQGDKG